MNTFLVHLDVHYRTIYEMATSVQDSRHDGTFSPMRLGDCGRQDFRVWRSFLIHGGA